MKRQSHEPEGRTKRRKKISVACDVCRLKKNRCDGVQPVCGPCSKRSDLNCVYTGELEKKRATQSYISRLEDRIKQLESPKEPENCHSSEQQSPERFASIPRHASKEGSVESIQGDRYLNPFVSTNDREDGVNAMMGTVEEGCASQGIFGSSSAAGFMRQIKTAIDKRVSSPNPHLSTTSLALRSSSLLSGRHDGLPSGTSSAQNYVLPPRRTADRLMGVYWDYVFPLYPFVDSNAMKFEYTKIWRGETLQHDEHMVMCTFNVIFALASQLADFIAPEEREGSADIFFARAKDLFQFNLWDTGSAGLIQCLLLMAQYLQSTDSAHQCWIVTGLAIRNAQSLGLHLPQTVASFRSFHEQQMARKLWHGCVLMDRVISMTFGRPAMISRFSSEAVPLPEAVDDELISSGATSEPMQPENKPSILAFYAKTLELYEIMNNVLLSLYKPALDDSQDDMHDFYFNNHVNEGDRSIFELDRSLTQWTRSLPPHLRGSSQCDSENQIFVRQSIVLRARFLHVRMLLFRPTLSKYCGLRDTSPPQPLIPIQDSFPHRVASQCSIICVQAAQESIQLIYTNIPNNGTGGPLPAWWYNILYVYTSATVLLAGKLCPAIKSEIPIATISHSWNCALEILRKYQNYSRSARRCVAALEILYEKVVHEGQIPADNAFGSSVTSEPANILNDISFGEGINADMMEGFDLPDFQDMSWLNSVPSNLL